MAFSAWGEIVIEFIPGEDVGLNETVIGDDTIEKDGVTIHTSYGAFAAPQYRFGKNSVTTFTSVIGPMTKIEFVCTKDNPASGFSEPDLELNGYDGIWRGNATQVTFVAGNKQVRATKIVVTVDDGGLSSPRINPASGIYYEPIEVTISCATPDAEIYYTTNGSNPTTSSTLYTSPFVLSSSTTVKAISVLDENVSDVVSAEYNFVYPTAVQNVWEALLAGDEDMVRFINPVKVLAQYGNHLWVKDETGYLHFFGNCGQTYKNGDEIPAGFVGTMKTYSCEREMTNLSGFKPAVINTPIDPEQITCAQVGHATYGHYVVLRNATFIDEDNNYLVVDEEGNQAPVYFSMGVSRPSNLDGVYDIIAIVGSYVRDDNCIYQLLPVQLRTPGPPINLCDMMYGCEDNTIITVDEETQVIYQSGNYLFFVQDGCYGVIYGNVGQTYEQGDIIPPGWSARKTTWAGEPELTSPFTGFQPASRREPLGIDLVSPLEVDHDHWAHYVEMHEVYISNISYNTFTITDRNGNSCIGSASSFYGTIREGFYPWIRGIVNSFKSAGNIIYQLLVTDLGGNDPEPDPVSCFDELQGKPDGTKVRFIEPLTVICHTHNRCFAKDKCGGYGMLNGELEGQYVNGDLIMGDAIVQSDQNSKYVTLVGEWEKEGQTDAEPPVQCDFIEEVARDQVYWYLSFDNVSLEECDMGEKYRLMTDDTDEMPLYNAFGIEYYDSASSVNPPAETWWDLNGDYELSIADLNLLIHWILSGEYQVSAGIEKRPWYPYHPMDDGLYYVEGILMVYHGELELWPIAVIKHGVKYRHLLGDYNEDDELTVADINLLIDLILSKE